MKRILAAAALLAAMTGSAGTASANGDCFQTLMTASAEMIADAEKAGHARQAEEAKTLTGQAKTLWESGKRGEAILYLGRSMAMLDNHGRPGR